MNRFLSSPSGGLSSAHGHKEVNEGRSLSGQKGTAGCLPSALQAELDIRRMAKAPDRAHNKRWSAGWQGFSQTNHLAFAHRFRWTSNSGRRQL
ncbi:hypothetical protein NDU88_000899 [Pleurodeles waltl]|uniref:Uncharacterized protein n=1 Tax=Pleurodeles waltl TaxID=8319 RepID=A0AAV7URA9_PLEWA|nr:hypothetical protein NDU88_000899 [Pleurodeles waltl]